MILAIVDVETSGLDPVTDAMIEVGCVLWSVQFSCVIAAWSDLVKDSCPTNGAEKVNFIPTGSLALGLPIDTVVKRLGHFVGRADVLVAHPANFESRRLPDFGKPWVCSMYDVRWPRRVSGRSLASLAVAHGVQVAQTHRALVDCLLLAQVFEAAGRLGMDVRTAIEKALARRLRS
jgi:DNA polymerase-3 subunit epsilon